MTSLSPIYSAFAPNDLIDTFLQKKAWSKDMYYTLLRVKRENQNGLNFI